MIMSALREYLTVGCYYYKVGSDLLVREAEVRLHVAAALAHTVNLGLFHVHSSFDGCVADNGGDGEDTLTADTG